jgi:hypothetical protein
MSFIDKLRVEERHGSASTPSSNKGGVSGGLRAKLGEELAAMLEQVGRKVYAAAMERTRKAIGESLLANRSVLAKSLRQEFGRRGSKNARRAVAEWLDEIVGDVLTDVAEEVYEDLPEIADALVEKHAEEEEEPPMEEETLEEEGQEEDEDESMEDMPEEDEEPEEEPEGESFAAEGLNNVADELEDIKAAGLAQAARLAKMKRPDDAAYLRMVLSQL